MYTSFRVQNFRCFEDLKIDDLARINLIAGKNNTGKTSLLETIMLRSGNFDAKFLLRDIQYRGPWKSASLDFDTNKKKQPESTWDFDSPVFKLIKTFLRQIITEPSED